jgi:hypothetical protein
LFSFQSRLVKPEGTGTWTYAPVPAEIEKQIGERGLVKVKGTVNGIPIRSSLMPQGDGSHYIVVNKSIRDKAGVKAGDQVNLELSLDSAERRIEPPDDLSEALKKNPPARSAFEKHSYSRRKEYIDYINESKKSETRSRRIEKSIYLLTQNKTIK